MEQSAEQSHEILTIRLEGKIDSSNAEAVGKSIFKKLDTVSHEALVFDTKDLEFVSSSGLRILMKAVRKEADLGNRKVSVIQASRDIYDVFEMTGFNEMLEVYKAYRELSVEGCPVIGKGAFGTVYRLDPDTVVKVYQGEDSIQMIKTEMSRAQKAFVKGIPTAISYDIVRVGKQYGAVFELLKARGLNALVAESQDDRQRLEELIRKYVECVRLVHGTVMEEGVLPQARTTFLEYLEILKGHLADQLLEKLRRLLTALPEDLHAVHGDFHLKNIMICDGEPMLIDMETLSTGQPIFDLQGMYLTYQAFGEDQPDSTMQFLGIRQDTADYIWKRMLELYFETEDTVKLKSVEDKIRVVAAVRFLYLMVAVSWEEQNLKEKRIRHTCEHLEELLPRITTLSI